MPELTLEKTIRIEAPVSKVWKALTTPELIREYYFGMTWVTDWEKGSPILFRGTWDHEPFEDKGNILAIETEKYLHFNFWISGSGTADLPENYTAIRYDLAADGDATVLTLTEGGLKSQKDLALSEEKWRYVLYNLKEVVAKMA